MNADVTTTLYRPVGQKELDLIAESDWRRFPPRRAEQPIFYPVLTEDYAAKIARDWNTKSPNSGYVGYMLRFNVGKAYLDRYEVHEVGSRDLREYWIPSEELDVFNSNIVGEIELTQEFRPVDSQDG